VSSRSRRGRVPGGTGLLLIPAAAFVVHQLRYTLTYGARASSELSAQGHSYLHSLVPWFVLALGVGLSVFVRRTAHAARTGETGTFGRQSASLLWALTAAGLVAIYSVQESLEELLASGHPTGIAGVFGHGGWWAIPASAFVAAFVVAILRLGRSIIRAAASLAPVRRHIFTTDVAAPGGVALVLARPLARSAAGRAPPR
jgi:hypothetical protein